MVVLGILLLVVALAVLAFVLLGGLPPGPDTQVSLEVLGLALDTTAVAVFGLGALTLLLLELAVLCIRSGARKSARRRAELQRLRRVEAEVQQRQAAEAQRNASAAEPSYAPAAAPFARRDTGDRPAPDAPGTSEADEPAAADGRRDPADTEVGTDRAVNGADEDRDPSDAPDARTATLATPGPTPPSGGSSAASPAGDGTAGGGPSTEPGSRTGEPGTPDDRRP